MYRLHRVGTVRVIPTRAYELFGSKITASATGAHFEQENSWRANLRHHVARLVQCLLCVRLADMSISGRAWFSVRSQTQGKAVEYTTIYTPVPNHNMHVQEVNFPMHNLPRAFAVRRSQWTSHLHVKPARNRGEARPDPTAVSLAGAEPS